MKILLTSDFYPPFIGGAERQVQLLAAVLSQRGHEVKVGTIWHADLPELEYEGDVEVRRLRSRLLEHPRFSTDPVRRFHPPLPVPGIVSAFRALMATDQPDVVHANGWIAYSNAAALTGMRTPLVLSVRDYGYSCAVRTLMYYDRGPCAGPGLKKCLRCANHRYGTAKAVAAVAGVWSGRHLLTQHVQSIHAVSTHIQSIVERDLVRSDPSWQPAVRRIADIPPAGVVAPDSGAADAVLPDEPFILFVGQLTQHKGLQALLAAYGRLASPPPLVLIGTQWPDTPSTFPPGVINLGEMPHDVVLTAYGRALFGVVPSIWPDPLPGVVREAMSQGTPVVGSSVGGIPDMIDDGRTGLLVTPADVDELSAAMARLLSDPLLRGRLGAAARQATAAISATSIAIEFERLYQTAIDRSAAPMDAS